MLYFAAQQTTTGLEPFAVDLIGSNSAVCSSPNQRIPDNTTRGTIHAISVPQHATIGNITVDLRLSHTYIGDLSATLTHVSTGHSITLIQRADRCESDDLDVVFDDAERSRWTKPRAHRIRTAKHTRRELFFSPERRCRHSSAKILLDCGRSMSWTAHLKIPAALRSGVWT